MQWRQKWSFDNENPDKLGFHLIKKENYSIQSDKKSSFIYVNFAGKNTLRPAKRYSIFWADEADPKVVEMFDEGGNATHGEQSRILLAKCLLVAFSSAAE